VCHLDTAILGTFGELSRRARKGYCYPSQRTILKLAARFYGVSRSRRTLNRRLSFLEHSGFFVRVRRIRRGPDGSLVMRSTLYKLKGKFYNYMGLAYRRVESFFQVFRVPFVALNQRPAPMVSERSVGGAVDNPVDNSERGGPSGIFQAISPPSGPSQDPESSK